MLRIFSINQLLPIESELHPLINSIDDVAWVNLRHPTVEERATVMQQLNFNSLHTIEQNLLKQPNWLDSENEIIYFRQPYSSTSIGPTTGSGINFILTQRFLVTLDNLEFDIAAELFTDEATPFKNPRQPEDYLIALLERMLVHFSGEAEAINNNLYQLSKKVFVEPKDQSRAWRRSINLRKTLREIGNIGAVTIALNDNLHRLERIPQFLVAECRSRFTGNRRAKLIAIKQDVNTLKETVTFIQQQNTLVLDASLGIINLEENFVMRWLTVIATIFIPPTLVASVYGMNFEELSVFGGQAALPVALILIVLSGLIPFFVFIRRGWL